MLLHISETALLARRHSRHNCVGSADPRSDARVRRSLALSFQAFCEEQVHVQYDTVIDVPRSGQSLDGASRTDLLLMPHSTSEETRPAVVGVAPTFMSPAEGPEATNSREAELRCTASIAGPAALCQWNGIRQSADRCV